MRYNRTFVLQVVVSMPHLCWQRFLVRTDAVVKILDISRYVYIMYGEYNINTPLLVDITR